MANRYRKPGSRTKRQRGSNRARALKVIVVLVLVVAAGYSAAWAAGKAWHRTVSLRMFSVSRVMISGLKHVRDTDLVEYLGPVKGTSIFRVDLDSLVDRLSAHPWISAATVKRELPDGICLMLTERVPAAVANTTRGSYLVDTQGAVLANVDPAGWAYLPAIACDGGGAPGRPGGGPVEGIAMALELTGVLNSGQNELLAGSEVHLGRDGVPYLVVDGSKVELGRDGYADKVERLSEIISDVRKRGVAVQGIDLRFPGKVIIDGGVAGRS
jgi:cell division protein FtsQ